MWWRKILHRPAGNPNYAEPLKTIMTLNQDALSPYKSSVWRRTVVSAPNKGAVTACLSQRKRAMESRVRDTFSARSNIVMVIGTGSVMRSWHRATPRVPPAMRLAKTIRSIGSR